MAWQKLGRQTSIFMRQTYDSGEENKGVALRFWAVDSYNEKGDKDQSSDEEHRVVLDQVPLFVGFEVSVHGSESLKVSRMSVFDGFSFVIEECKGHQRKKNAQQNSEYGEDERDCLNHRVRAEGGDIESSSERYL
jgi:hypothetical protein